jgi:hypothetical protein
MTTQAVTASVFSGSGGRDYSATATDGEWTRLTSTIGSAQLGFAQTGALITHVQSTYAGGSQVFRIRNSVSQVTKIVGMGFKVGTGGPAPYSGAGYSIVLAQDDVLEVYTAAVA